MTHNGSYTLLARTVPFVLVLGACREKAPPEPAVWGLELTLGAPGVSAGNEVGYVVTAVSSKGGRFVPQSWTLSSEDEPGLVWNQQVLRPTLAGMQHIHATAEVHGETLDAEVDLPVSAGPTMELELTLETRAGSYEVGDQVITSVHTEDAWGNTTKDPWTLTVDGGTAEIDGDVVIFASDGLYTVTATLDGSALADSEGPILVDSSGPVFDMNFPVHEDTTTSTRVAVSGVVTDPWSGILYAAVNGTPVSVGEAGGILQFQPWDFGLNVVTLAAVDYDGNRTDLVHTVLVGEFLDPTESVASGLVVHLGSGEGGLDAVLTGVKAEISSIDLSSAFPIDITGSKYDLTIPGIDYTIEDVDIVPDDGQLVATATLTDLSVPIEGKVKAVFWLDATGSVDIDSVGVAVGLVPRVTSSGRLVVDVAETEVEIENLQLNFESTLFAVIESLGLDTIIEDYVTNMLEDQLAYQVQLAVQSNVELALSSLELSQTVAVTEEDTFDLTGQFSSVAVDEGGITVGFDVSIQPSDGSEIPETTLPGSLSGSYGSPDLSTLGGISAGMNMDLINRVLYIAWANGAMDQTLDAESVGLTPEAIDLLFPGTTAVTFTTEAMMPPVVIPGTLFSQLVAQFGSLRLLAVDQDGNLLLDLYVSVILDVAVETDGVNLTPTLTLNGDPWVEVAQETAQSTGVINYDALIALLLPQALEGVSSSITAMPIPTVSEATVTISRLALYGDEGGYLTAIGSIDVAD